MKKYLSVKINNAGALIGIAMEAVLKGEESIQFTLSENQYKDSDANPDYVGTKKVDMAVWVKESKL